MLNFWDYMVIALYVVALVIVGWLASKKVKNAKDYISANRGLGIIVMIGSLAGAAIGAGGTIGLAGDVYTKGVSGYWQIIGWNIGWLMLVFMAKRLWSTGASSVVDVFGKSCGKTTRLAAALACLVFSVPALSTQLIGLGNMFKVVFSVAGIDLDYKIFVTISCIIMVFAVFKGGLYSSAYSGTFNFFILAVVFVICLPIFTCVAAGGASQAITNIEILPASFKDLFAGVSVSATLLAIVKYCFTAGSNIAYVNNTLAAKDAKTARNGSIGGIISYFIIPGIIMVCTLVLINVFPNLENPSSVMTFSFLNIFPPVIRGLSVIALIAVVLSTATIWVQNSGKIFGSDIYAHVKKNATDDEVLKVCKWATIFWAIVSWVIAMFIPQVMIMFNIQTNLYGSSIFFPLVAVLFWKGATKQGITAGIFVGMISSLILTIAGNSPVDPVVICSLLNGVTLVVVSLLTKNKEGSALNKFAAE